MSNAKRDAVRAIEPLPSDASLEEVMARLYFMHEVERGLQQIASGRVVSHADAERRMRRA